MTKADIDRAQACYDDSQANACYLRRHANAMELLKRIATQLAKHKKRAAKTPEDWQYAGDLYQVGDDLEKILVFLGGHDTLERY